MKKIHIAIIIGIALSNATPALAASGSGDLPWCESTDCTMTHDSFDGRGNGCVDYTSECYYGTQIYSCRICRNGYTLKLRYTQPSDCYGEVEYYTCCPDTCSNCTSTSWTSAGGGSEKREVTTCDCGTCRKTTEYRCAASYYGSGSSCSACPNGGDSVAGSTSITSCYISGSFSDSTGSGTYTGSCYYSN